MSYEARIICDSICNGHRLTTMQWTHPLIIHAEVMTHCMFARNASSSRAIPFSKMVRRVKEDPYIPARFGRNQKGMQSSVDLSRMDHESAVRYWLTARDRAIEIAEKMADPGGLDIHKQIVNRLLGPWMWITVCVTGDAAAYSNYFAQRCHEAADFALQGQSWPAQRAYYLSRPVEMIHGMWHLPYLSNDDMGEIRSSDGRIHPVSVSTGRCARTSYLTQEGNRDFAEDVNLHDRLRSSNPGHFSPFEHPARATGTDERHGKYTGWQSYRHMMPREYITDFVPNHPDLVLTDGIWSLRPESELVN